MERPSNSELYPALEKPPLLYYQTRKNEVFPGTAPKNRLTRRHRPSRGLGSPGVLAGKNEVYPVCQVLAKGRNVCKRVIFGRGELGPRVGDLDLSRLLRGAFPKRDIPVTGFWIATRETCRITRFIRQSPRLKNDVYPHVEDTPAASAGVCPRP